MPAFVERILSVEDQQDLSQEWYGNAHYSEHEVLEETQEIIKRNGREFTIKAIDNKEGFTVDANMPVSADAVILKDGEEYDQVWLLDSDDEFVFLEGEDRDFIYQIKKSEFPRIKPASVLAGFNDPTYSPDREWSDWEMDVLL